MTGRTHLAKAIEASRGQSTKTLRGLLDQASKAIVADRQILARIVHECVSEAKQYTVEELEQLIPAEVSISAYPVSREDHAAGKADPGKVRQENTEDGTVHEGTVRFDILFNLELPGAGAPILLIINVEVQNKKHVPYPLEKRAMIYTSRLLSRQGTDFSNCRKVYSIWIVAGQQSRDTENTIRHYEPAEKLGDQSYREPPEALQMFEIWFLNLGEPEDHELESPLLKMLDVVFSGKITTEEKLETLETDFGLQMNADFTNNLERMCNMELAIEVRAHAEGRAEGRAEGIVEATLGTARALNLPPEAVRTLLTANFSGDRRKAERELRKYLDGHPEEDTGQFRGPGTEADTKRDRKNQSPER